MKKLNRVLSTVLIFIFASVFALSAGAKQKTVRVAVMNYPNFIERNEDAPSADMPPNILKKYKIMPIGSTNT